MLRIVTDGAADILPEWQKEFGIEMIPVNILFGEKSYLQGVELDNEGFYRLVDETKRIPKTSQPSPHQFVEFYRKVAQKGDTILSIHITAKLSGTYASAIAAAEELKGEFNVIPIDSAVGSLAPPWSGSPLFRRPRRPGGAPSRRPGSAAPRPSPGRARSTRRG